MLSMRRQGSRTRRCSRQQAAGLPCDHGLENRYSDDRQQLGHNRTRKGCLPFNCMTRSCCSSRSVNTLLCTTGKYSARVAHCSFLEAAVGVSWHFCRLIMEG